MPQSLTLSLIHLIHIPMRGIPGTLEREARKFVNISAAHQGYLSSRVSRPKVAAGRDENFGLSQVKRLSVYYGAMRFLLTLLSWRRLTATTSCFKPGSCRCSQSSKLCRWSLPIPEHLLRCAPDSDRLDISRLSSQPFAVQTLRQNAAASNTVRHPLA